MLGYIRVFQNTSLPLMNARFTPASRAAIASYRLFLSTGAGQFPQLEDQVRRHVQALESAR